MIVYEDGGASTDDKGEATIVCGKSGERLSGSETGGGVGFAHACFDVQRDEAMLVVAHWRKWDELPAVWAVVSLSGASVAVGTAATDAPEHLRPAVQAAINKAMCVDCTHAHYLAGGGD